MTQGEEDIKNTWLGLPWIINGFMHIDTEGMISFTLTHSFPGPQWMHRLSLFYVHIDGLVQEGRGSSALATELRLPFTKKSLCRYSAVLLWRSQFSSQIITIDTPMVFRHNNILTVIMLLLKWIEICSPLFNKCDVNILFIDLVARISINIVQPNTATDEYLTLSLHYNMSNKNFMFH